MMGRMTETTVELANVHSTAKRVVLGLVGLGVAIFPVWDLWPGIASLSLVSPVFWIIGLGAAGIGLALLAAAIFGRSVVLRVGPEGIMLHRDSPVGRRTTVVSPEALGPIRVERQEWSEGPATWRVAVELRGTKPLLSDDFRDPAGAEQLAARLAVALGRSVG